MISASAKAWAIARRFDDGWTVSRIARQFPYGYSTIQHMLAAERERRGIPAYNAVQTAERRAMRALSIGGRCPICSQGYRFDSWDGEALEVCGCGSAYIARRSVPPAIPAQTQEQATPRVASGKPWTVAGQGSSGRTR